MTRSVVILICISAALVVGAIGIIVYTAGKSAGMFRFVDEVKAQSAELQGREIWMSGDLEPGTHRIRVDESRREQHRFELSHRGERIEVYFTGVFPRNARPGRQLVVRGKLDKDGRFRAVELRTKCPSKYKSQYNARK